MRKGPWHKTKGNFGGAELEDSEYPHLREEMLSISKELFIEQEKQRKPLLGGRHLPGVYSLTMLGKQWLSQKGRD